MIFICMVVLKTTQAFEIQELDPLYQVAHQSVKIQDVDFQPNKYFSYGIWSKYTPLSAIPKTGPVGLFESDCYHLHHVLDKENNELNLIYYDCLDFEASKITKTIKFVNDKDEQKTYQIEVEIFKYESFWYFLEVLEWPLQQRFEIFIISQEKIIIHSIDEMNYPFKGRDLQFTFGSSLIVSNSRIESIQKDQKFSYFPGTIIKQNFMILEELTIIDWFDYVKGVFADYEVCNCQPNYFPKIEDLNIDSQQKGDFVSQNIICDSFIFSGWVKIQEIIKEDSQFLYPFIKLAASFEDSRLSNDNLSPFQIQYKLSDNQNQIIVTTYSYTFPKVSIDFSADPFLIKESFDIIQNIHLWHKIQVKLIGNSMDIQIKFYEQLMIFEYSLKVEVHQFQSYYLKLVYGNIKQLNSNYLSILMRNFFFLNCDQIFSEHNCHNSCQECDGPTNEDCLSCSEESKRIYLPEHKVCVCPYNTVDDQICIGYQETKLEFIDEPYTKTDCQFGYFEVDNECVQCPSIIRDDLIVCVECLQNPKSFSQKPFCEYDLYIGQSQQTQRLQWTPPDQLLFDGNDVSMYPCIGCNNTAINDFNYLYSGFLYSSFPSKLNCLSDDYKCLQKMSQTCKEYVISVFGVRCNRCSDLYIQDGIDCIFIFDNMEEPCQKPYYKSFDRKCKLCPKRNCVYCFEYQDDESSFKSTLYKDFESPNSDQMIQIGCAMCEDGFIFDFKIGECLRYQSKIQTCLRSFINLDGIEICTLSTQNDFSVAPEIVNCDTYYSNCLQCVLTPSSKLQCVLCREGYVSSIITGNCELNQLSLVFQNSTYVIEGGVKDQDGYVQLIQSFLMQFLPDSYYYSYSPEQISYQTIKCKNGYDLTIQSMCFQYCRSECLNCQKDYYSFICMRCPLNYYKRPMLVELNGQCIACSNLCQYCSVRNQDEISALQPNFELQESNTQFTTKCLKSVKDPNIVLDTNLGNAKYCFNKSCQNWFSFSVYFTECMLDRYLPDSYQDDINFQYCNLVGVDQMTINYIISLQDNIKICDGFAATLWNGLKKKIFSLKKTNMRLFPVKEYEMRVSSRIEILNFDAVELKNITFVEFYGCNLENPDNKVDITLNNINFIKTSFTSLTIFQTKILGNIVIQDVNLLDSVFVNSTFFDFSKQTVLISFHIKNLTFKNCRIENSILFNIDYIQDILTIENILIENCVLLNSAFFTSQTDLNRATQIRLINIEITQCNFDYSFLLQGDSRFEIIANNLFFHNNYLKNSVFITFNDNLDLVKVRSSYNTLIESSILSTLILINEQRLMFTLDDFEDDSSNFQQSSLIIVYSSLQINNFYVNIKNVKVQENSLPDKLYLQNYLFKFHCHSLIVQNAQFLNLQNLAMFYLYEINQINFNSVIFENSQQDHKVPVSQSCTDLSEFRNQPLYIIGFQQLSLLNIQIVNQFSINYSLMDISFSTQFIIDKIGQIILENVQFRGNVILKNKVATSLSLINIFSQYNLNIKLTNFQFIQNIVNQQIDEPLDTQTNLLHISSLDSFLQIQQLYFNQNALTNSTNPIITLTATLIEISNLIFMNSNFLSQSLWQQFYDFELENQYNQQEINSIIQSTFKILNQGIYIAASTFSCEDCFFQEIIAIKASIFQIKTQGQGIIKISNLEIDSVYTNLKDTGSSGCISVDSTNSLLSIDLRQIKFTNIFNRMSTSLFSITPSLKENVIRLNNIEIKNCLSLKNTVMLAKFSAEVMKQSLVSINNLSIYQSEELWFQLFSLIGDISLSELESILSLENAMIFLENCKVDIQNLNVEGIVISPIFKFYNAFTLRLFDCKLMFIKKLYSFDLIHITQTIIAESKISIEKLKILQSITYKEQSDGIPIFQDLNYKILGCSVWRSASQTGQTVYSNIISQIQSSADQSNQLIYVKSISDQNSIRLSHLEIINNDGSDFSNGMITFEVEQFKIIKIDNIFCFQNDVKENGCFYFLIQNFINSTIIIKDSYFLQNKGSLGSAILIQNVKLRMTNCKIISNYASKSGGGLFLQLKDTDFQIKQTIITNNEALVGGGIYFNEDGTILLQNFIKSFLLFNKATQFGDNLIESPSHLTLLINNLQMQSKKQDIKSILSHHLALQPYSLIEQGKPFITNYLMIPSNQVIDQYQIYQPSKVQYSSYITNFVLILKNSLNEQLPNLLSTTCTLTSKTINELGLTQEDGLAEQQNLQFDLEKDYYNLGSLFFVFDPYNQENKQLQIEISCKSVQHQKVLNYIIQAKSLKCQLGEFYVNSGCQICSSSQGFYSVVYDATKCSIFDKTKFNNITENNIELLEGFWRPDYLSDFIEQCFKNFKFCKGGWGYGNQICDLGHIGALCEECDIYNIRGDGKYLKNQQDSQCISCFGVEDSIIPFIAASIWSFISIIITLRSIEQSNQLFKCLKLQQRFSKIIFNLEQGHESFLIKMLLNYLWIFSVIFTFNIQFSFSFTFVDSASNTSYSMTNNLDCYLSENQEIKLIYSKIITMLVLMIFQFILIIMGYLIYNWYKKIGLSNFNLETISNTILYLYISNYGGLVKMYFSIVSKRTVSSQSYIQGDVSLFFGSREHLIWIFAFVIPGLCVFSMIIPLSLFMVMYIKKDQHDTIQIRKHFCYLINEYNNRSYFWEEIKLIKKTIIILILTYFETYILLKASLLGLCLLFYQLLAFNEKPYILSNFNSKDLSSAQICSITIFLAAAKYVAEQENNQFSSISLQTIIVLLCIKLCYAFIKSILEVYSNKYANLILNYLYLILNMISQDSSLTLKLKNYLQKSSQRKKRSKYLIKKLKQYLLKASKAQLQGYQKVLSSHIKETQSTGSEQKYFLKIDTD
ncbi:unnamed protein product (macronuclear) [Paramecium tetraurelia]|uniref:Transmembrane protein n=1 Tax=Paramecium tetraurelia TaxID=5888 RepID=A0BRX6_PARTE|nr:uncharacterized protein GSPATT00031524001 [Paramecium tetraurelia]CAK61293.1 unnamed protein product [Paramecium tetraurelia]|eukprot:XP_001428691.1 hypothetical protein (macronuclear) [Paramecium tetraurelia strain d4-2]